MRRFALIAVSVAIAMTAGCGKGRITGPASLGNGDYIVGSYSKALSSEKVKMIKIAEEFCKDRHQDLTIKNISITDRKTGQRTAVAIAETIIHQAGNIEVIFSCGSGGTSYNYSATSGVTVAQKSESVPKVTQNLGFKKTDAKPVTSDPDDCPDRIYPPRWDSSIRQLNMARETRHGWGMGWDEEAGIGKQYNWACVESSSEKTWICYGLDAKKDNRFWVMTTAYRGEWIVPNKLHSVADYYEVNKDRTQIRKLKHYTSPWSWGGGPELGGNVIGHTPDEKESAWHAIPGDLRDLLHYLMPEKY